MKYELDVKNLNCPLPLIETKRLLNKCVLGDEVVIACNDDVAQNNIITYLEELGLSAVIEGDIITCLLTKLVGNKKNKINNNNYVVTISSNEMGSGDSDLGAILMKAFINSLLDIDNLPSHICFYNSGIFLVTKQSSIIDSLSKLESLGVNIVVCGTCVDFYEKKQDVAIGTISNMYSIADILINSSKILKP